MEQIHERVAGLDVHRDSVAACVRMTGPRGGVVSEKERFATTTTELARLAGWLAERQVTLVAMEATGVYWKPVYYALERRLRGVAVQRASRQERPRPQDGYVRRRVARRRGRHGMVRPSFVPPPAIRELRELTRYRKTQIDARVAEIQRLEKLLQDAGIKLTSVASKVLTQSGRLMVEALIAGQHDPAALAELAKGKLRPKIPQLTEALNGHFGAHHAVAARRIFGHVDFLDASIATLTEQIDVRMQPYAAARRLLAPIPGFDRLIIDTVIAETGADMTEVPERRPPGELGRRVPRKPRVGWETAPSRASSPAIDGCGEP